MKNSKGRSDHLGFTVVITSTIVLTSCAAWNEPSRVETDFGQSVRAMVAAQIYDVQAAQNPSLEVPPLQGTAADAGIYGYAGAASQARQQRTDSTGSPLPIVGIATDSK